MPRRTDRPIGEQHITKLDSAVVAYEVAGQGPPLVLVHGLAGSRRWWRHNVPALARHYRVYTVDLIGFGGSKGSTRFALDAARQILATWIQQVVAEPTALAGHSMGGLIAAELTAAHPELVSRLVLVNAAALPIGRRYLRHAWGLAGVLRYARVSLLPVLLVDSLRAGPRTMLGAMWQILNANNAAPLAGIHVPTLVIWGQHDKLLPQAMGRQIHSEIPGATFVTIEGAGHNPMWERPAAFNAAVLEFLKQPT